VVAISTDKACKPVNVMGMTKSLQERVFVAANVLNPDTRLSGSAMAMCGIPGLGDSTVSRADSQWRASNDYLSENDAVSAEP
jgi:hypothetical protein